MAQQPHRTDQLQHASFLLILAVVSMMMAVIVWPFATALLWAALAAIMFQPLYRWMLRKMRGRRNAAAIVSLLVIFFAVLVPGLWLGAMVVQEALVLVSALQERPVDLAATFDTIYGMLPEAAQEAVDRSGWADVSSAQTRLQELLAESAGMIASQAVSIGSGALGFMLSFGVGLYVMFFLLRDGERIGRTLLNTVPVERSVSERLAERFLGIVRATIKGSGVVGLVQGAMGAVTFFLVGLESALLFGVLMTIFALVPVIGAGAVYVPVGLWLLVTGAVWQGVFVLAFGFIVISSADNVLRPILVGRDTGIPDWIILVTTLGGISFLGFSGIVLGPLVAGLFLASWSILQEYRDEDARASEVAPIAVDASGRVPDADAAD
ncbi:AI-2E family transporter [Erythrobacter dokdonensis]|jgi:predicted PurR-regulated permease PerM|uniref:Membrane protein n=1 Tax=Erythrobacter dokdonensis DSW-74 TaxID=1300349 RepID=A0A1A7BII3_9SPHN|nr:AI-2E family transporter [Erythrobacter dokdonensis]MEE4316621.1 AI-2E family transporter [Erythrobacter sp.]OBV11015.1 Membrane protein [Erythrobacter dokdonensis DSW-74]